MADVAAKAPKTVKAKASKGEKKPTTQALIKEAILALKVSSCNPKPALEWFLNELSETCCELMACIPTGKVWIFTGSH